MNQYYNGYDFSDGMVQLFKDSYDSVFVTKDGTVAFEADSDLSYEAFKAGRAVVYNYEKGQYGYVNESGETVIPFTLDEAYSFVGDYALYKELGKYGVIDNNGKFVMLPTFKAATMTEDGFVVGFDGVFTVFLNKDLEPIHRMPGDQTSSVWSNLIIESGDEGYDYKDFSGRVLGNFNDYWDLGDYMFDSGSGQLIDSSQIASDLPADENLSIVSEYSYKFINSKGEVAIDLSGYDSANPFSEGLAVVEKNGKFGYIDTTGKVVIPIKYLAASDFYSGEASVETVSDYLYINKLGETVESDYGYDNGETSEDSDYYVISTGYYGDSGVANRKTDKIVLKAEYSSVTDYGNGIFELMDDNYNYGFFNANTGTIVTPAYEYITIYSDSGTVLVESEDSLYGMLDFNGKVIVEPKYDYITEVVDGLYEVQKDYSYGIIDSEGQVLIIPEFDYIYSDEVIEDVVVFSTEKGTESHIMIYNEKTKKVLSDTLEGSAIGYGESFIVLSNMNGLNTVAGFDGSKLYETKDYFVDANGKYLQFETESGTDYVVDTNGKTYLENNKFNDIYMPVEEEHIIFSNDDGYGIVNLSGQVTTEQIYKNVSFINAGIMSVYDKGNFGYVNLSGDDIIESGSVDFLFNFTDGLGLIIKAE